MSVPFILSLFQDFKRVMTGQQQKSPRWKKCTEYITTDLELASGALYVDEHFAVTDKQEVVEMVKNLRDSFLEMLNRIDWMDNQTKTTAIEKVRCAIKLKPKPKPNPKPKPKLN